MSQLQVGPSGEDQLSEKTYRISKEIMCDKEVRDKYPVDIREGFKSR